jgi:hypothetical protein
MAQCIAGASHFRNISSKGVMMASPSALNVEKKLSIKARK